MTHTAMRKFVILFLSGFLVCAASAAQGRDKARDLQEALQTLGPDDEIAVIVKFADKVDVRQFKDKGKAQRGAKMIKALKEKADRTQGPVRAFLEKRKAKHMKPLWIINGIAATVPAGAVRELALQPGVESISLDYTLSAPVTTTGTAALPEWNLSAINAPALWSLGYTGTGVVVANMDTGVDLNHPDLQSKWRGGNNSWYDPNGEHLTPYDADGHGTGTMGIMVGGDAGGSTIGVAPGARWIAVKIFNDADTAAYSVIHQGFQWLLDPDENPDTNDAPDVLNNSWGLDAVDECNTEFQPDIQALKAAEIFVVIAAGNSGPNYSTSVSPANYPGSFPTGAVDQSFIVDYSSSRGPSACDGSIYPELVAPGVNIKTADLTFGGVVSNSYRYVDGTSFASPHVAGAAALLLSAFPGLIVGELEAMLMNSAVDLGVTEADNDYGYGMVDVYGAFIALAQPDISVSPLSVDFGTVLLFRTSYRTVAITNTEKADLVMTNVEIAGTNASMFRVTNWSGARTIRPGMIDSLKVVFMPTSRGLKTATLRITSNDPDTPVVDIPLSGTGR